MPFSPSQDSPGRRRPRRSAARAQHPGRGPQPSRPRRARARLPRWLVEGAETGAEAARAPPRAAGLGRREDGNSGISSKDGLASPLRAGGGQAGRRVRHPRRGGVVTPGSVAQFSTREDGSAANSPARPHTCLSFPGLPVGAAGPGKAGGGAGPARLDPGPAPPGRVRVSRAARPPDKADNMATSARTSSPQVAPRRRPGDG